MIAHSVSATAYVDTPFLAQAPYLRAALNTFCCPLQAARLMRLAPGSTIKEHRDADLDIDYGFARLHVPIITNPDVGFFLNGRRIVMEPGSLWYLRLSDPHRVSNDGETDRVHLVVDAVANDWLAALFDEALVATGR
jgi:aspartyl/asparaginyl beta-hydroxylase (cupin superfamily)